jgi:hypothetical protein
MNELVLHFSMLSPDEDKAEEDLLRSLLGVLGYSAGSLERNTVSQEKITRHMRSEYLRIHKKL